MKHFDLIKRIAAIIGVVILLGLYLTTFFLAIFGSEKTNNLLMASLVMTVIVPVLFYAMLLIAKILSGKNVRDTLEKNGVDLKKHDAEDDSEGKQPSRDFRKSLKNKENRK